MSSKLSKLLIKLIKLYQITIAPYLGHCCRFYPTCSHYTQAALHKHGPLKGTWLGIKRILKCGPWHPGGPDPLQ